VVFASFKVSPSRAIELGDEEANIYAYRANAYGQNPDSRRYVNQPRRPGVRCHREQNLSRFPSHQAITPYNWSEGDTQFTDFTGQKLTSDSLKWR